MLKNYNLISTKNTKKFDLDMTQVNQTNPKTRPAIFFDRDGVLNQDHDYVHKIVDFHWIEGAIEAIRCCNELDYFVFVVNIVVKFYCFYTS